MGIQQLEMVAKPRRLQWLDHIERMEEAKTVRVVYVEAAVQEDHEEDGAIPDLEDKDITEWNTKSQNKKEWSKTITRYGPEWAV